VPGAHEALGGPADARAFARQFGYPLLLKAVAGGGGKGMRRVDSEAELEAAFRDASSEAERSFKNPDLYVEKLIERPRHIEIQLLGDRHGHMVHFGERECSIQRRHQKVMEECPSPLVAARPGMRKAMGEAAIRVARSAGYYNAGTVEFLVDAGSDFYFLEMNTRLQVEHPITELVTGQDLVRLQLEVAAGEKLRLRQEDIDWRGCAIECRIYAEDPYNNFFPSPGKITRLASPMGPGVRLDGCVYDGWTVPIDYDPLLAKLAVWNSTRETAIGRMLRALREYDVAGIHTNIAFFRQILEDEEFRAGHLQTNFVDEFLARRKPAAPPPELESVAALVAAFHSKRSAARAENGQAPRSRWLEIGRREALR
jgi:acetyl-CoA carboxylase biotin carboxylase subunit